jgi:hypothetical protein
MTILSLLSVSCAVNPGVDSNSTPVFSLKYDATLSDAVQDGRLLLLLATHDEKEPRFLVDNSAGTQLIFGRNVKAWEPGASMLIDQTAVGFPLASLSEVPAGRYYVQAVLNRYKDYKLANGKVVSLPPDRGEGQQWRYRCSIRMNTTGLSSPVPIPLIFVPF